MLEENKSTHKRAASYIARDTLLDQLRNQQIPCQEAFDTLFGIQNLLWLVVALALLRIPVLRVLRGQSPVDLGFLEWSFEGYRGTMIMFVLMMLSCYLFYLLHWLSAKAILHVRLCDVLFRLMSLLMLILPFKWISFRQLSPVPSFFLVLQAHSFFLKSFSFYSVIASAEEDGTAKKDLLNLRNFSYFIVAPTLVYRTKGYPKSDGIRIGFLLMQILRGLGLLAVIYLLITEQMLPVFYRAGNLSLLESIVLLTLPSGSLYLALFFITFEVALNIFAEVTFFADHYFYEDWWNSLSYDEFSRKWNRPVHEWLAQHVYKRARIRGFSRVGGIAYTTLFSAIFHEIILAITFGKFRLYMTMMMMLQIPLMFGMKLIMRKDTLVRKRIVNTFFWFGMFIGPAILITFNVYDWYIQSSGLN
ncbi:hypothetical protein GpartN1_g6819.t1 [Galdieria partita]|uniref:O-acyltransferase n=1 Tax=Galdieria partita TaxID=83374 RepID=A0A9C7Q208_9RHOD|nr:hypothetical protein GpartN1_g6819.t1 [Galdieria partita]